MRGSGGACDLEAREQGLKGGLGLLLVYIYFFGRGFLNKHIDLNAGLGVYFPLWHDCYSAWDGGDGYDTQGFLYESLLLVGG